MADRLTQLQDCLDDLATQMYASLNYIQTRHSYAHIDGQPDQNPNGSEDRNSNAPKASNAAGEGPPQDEQAPIPDSPEVFQEALGELAHDLVMKEQQIEYLINLLPGIGTSEKDQNLRIQALEKELRDVQERRKVALQEKSQLMGILGELAANCKRVY